VLFNNYQLVIIGDRNTYIIFFVHNFILIANHIIRPIENWNHTSSNHNTILQVNKNVMIKEID